MNLEAPSWADAIRVRRDVVVRRIAVAVDIEEERRGARIQGTLPPSDANTQAIVTRIIVRHLTLEGLVLGSFVSDPRITRPAAIRGLDDFGITEHEQLVRGRRHGGILVGSINVVRQLPDRLHLGLEIGGHQVPDLAGVHLRAEFRLLPATGIGVGGVHARFDTRRGGEERQARLAATVGQVIVVDADNLVLERLTIGELHRELRPCIHRGLRLGEGGRCLALRGDVLGHGLLLFEGPVLRVLGDSRLDGRGIGTCRPSAGCASLDAANRPIVHRVADQVELVADGSGHAGSREHDHQADDRDDQDVLDDSLASGGGYL